MHGVCRHAEQAMPLYQWVASPTTVDLYQAPVAIEEDDSLKAVGLCRYRLLFSGQYLAGIGVGEYGCLPLPDADGIGQEESPPEYLVQKPYRHIPFNQTSTGLQAIATYTGFQGSATEQLGVSDTGIFPCFYTHQSRQLMGLALTAGEGRLSSRCYTLLIIAGEVEWGVHHPLVAYLSPELEKTETGRQPELSESEDDGLSNDEVFILAMLPMLVAIGLCGMPACYCLINNCQCLYECGVAYGPSCRVGWVAFFQSIGRGITAMADYCLKCPRCCSQLLVSAVEAGYGHSGEYRQSTASTIEVPIGLDSESGLPGQSTPPAYSDIPSFSESLPDYDVAIQMPGVSDNSAP